jgi:hypothetical protein
MAASWPRPDILLLVLVKKGPFSESDAAVAASHNVVAEFGCNESSPLWLILIRISQSGLLPVHPVPPPVQANQPIVVPSYHRPRYYNGISVIGQ